MLKHISLFLMVVLISGCNGQTKTDKTDQKSLSATSFAEKINATDNAVVLDVRTPGEFEKGHLADALNMDWNGSEFESQLATLDKEQPVFVYCLSGGRSAKAVAKLQEEGFTNVYEMPGGMMEWRANNLPEAAKKSGSNGMSMAQYEALLDSDKLVLVDFYADWCAPCKKMEPYLKKIAEEMGDKVSLVRIDADENAGLCKSLNVLGLPVLKLYKDKNIIWENVGFIGEEAVRAQLN